MKSVTVRGCRRSSEFVEDFNNTCCYLNLMVLSVAEVCFENVSNILQATTIFPKLIGCQKTLSA
jgi:hypothetical protein